MDEAFKIFDKARAAAHCSRFWQENRAFTRMNKVRRLVTQERSSRKEHVTKPSFLCKFVAFSYRELLAATTEFASRLPTTTLCGEKATTCAPSVGMP